MSWFKNVFGSSKSDAHSSGGSSRSKSSSPPPPPPAKAQQAALDKIAALKEQIDILEKKIEFTRLKQQEEEEKVKAILRECGTDEKKRERKKPEITRHMAAIHRHKTVIEQETAKMLNLITISEQLETTLGNVQQQKVLSGVTEVMKGLAVNVDDVERTQEDLQEIMDDQKAVSEIMAQPLGAAFDVDESDLDAYYEEAMEEVPFDSFDYFIIVAHSVSQSAAQAAALPPLQPAVQLPSAGKKQLPQTAAQKESEDELDRCGIMSAFVFSVVLIVHFAGLRPPWHKFIRIHPNSEAIQILCSVSSRRLPLL
jgi:hypothetical protein